MGEIINDQQRQDDDYHDQGDLTPGKKLFLFVTPIAWAERMLDESRLSVINQRWVAIQTKETLAVQQFMRLACVASNVLENVFQLDGLSWSRLIRMGFFENSIDGISVRSRIKKPKKIVRILNNTLDAMESLSKFLDNVVEFNCDFIRVIHRTMLKDDNIEEMEIEEGMSGYRLIATGKFRSAACLTDHNNGNDMTQFCHHNQIEAEMDRYCDRVRDILANYPNMDPFMKAAWLQWAFLRIHPFEDGNGRVSRIISSIPLLKMCFPPIVVSPKNKNEYFAAIHAADRKDDLIRLSDFLERSMNESIEEIDNLPSGDALGTITSTTRRRTIQRHCKHRQ